MLGRDAASGGTCRCPPLSINRDRSHRAMLVAIYMYQPAIHRIGDLLPVRLRWYVTGQGSDVYIISSAVTTLPPRVLGRRYQLAWIVERHSSLNRELFGTCAHQQDMRTGQNRPCQHNGVLDALDSGDGSDVKRAPFHEAGIQLRMTILCQDSSSAGIESRIVLQGDNRGLNRIQGASTLQRTCQPASAAARQPSRASS